MQRGDKNFNFIEGSILSDTDLQKLPKNVNYVFHMAAIAGVRNSIENPDEYFEINLKGTSKLLNCIGSVNNLKYC